MSLSHGSPYVVPGPRGLHASPALPIAPPPVSSVPPELVAVAAPSSGSTERLPVEPRRALTLVAGTVRVQLGPRTLTLGRDPACDLVLADPSVDPVHCRIVVSREGWEVHDAASTNGTLVGGVRIHSALLAPGLELTLGRARLRCVGESLANDTDDGTRPAPTGMAAVLVGRSASMEHVRAQIARYAPLRFPVLVLGETGAGKELVARQLHERSNRARGPFVAVNAASIPESLVESELFGHERGAFTGAQQRRRGVFEEASGGTLFLDELGELPLAQQARLLRVLETGEIRRVGAEGTVKVDVRLVCATHRDLPKRARDGSFRADLLYRLDTLRVRLPPLRERPDDLPLLATHLLVRIAREIGCAKRLDDRALGALSDYAWPGNVRELYGVLCRAASESPGERIGIEHLGDIVQPPADHVADERVSYTALPYVPPSAPLPRDLDGPALLGLADAFDHNLSRLARVTGLARSTLRARLARARTGDTVIHPDDDHHHHHHVDGDIAPSA